MASERGEPAWLNAYPPSINWRAPLAVSTIPKMLDDAAERAPHRVALTFQGIAITYGELADLARRFAAALRERGIGRGKTVALYLPNSPYHPIALFGALKTGAQIVHLSPLDVEHELTHKLRDCSARVIITLDRDPFLAHVERLRHAGLLDLIIVGDAQPWLPEDDGSRPRAQIEGVETFSDLLANHAEVPSPATQLDDAAIIQYTGGTTGPAKGVVLTHRNVTAAIASLNSWMAHQPYAGPGQDRHICVLPLFHVFALVALMLRAIANAETIFLHARFDVDAVLHDVEVNRASWFFAVPTMLIALCAREDLAYRDLSSLRFCAAGGAALPAEVARRVEKITGHAVTIGWGMTETAGVGTITPGAGLNKDGSVGVPLPGIFIDVVSTENPAKVLSSGEVGELRVRGPNVMTAYLHNEGDATFSDGGLLTGDIGYVDEDGFVFLVDRKKDLIISGGFNVYPRAIEDAIYKHPAVEEVLVVGIPDAYRGEAAKAFIRLRVGHEPFTLAELRSFLEGRVGRQAVPSALEFRDSLPRTAVGKLCKKELRSDRRDSGD